jgi:hypothetical protein
MCTVYQDATLPLQGAQPQHHALEISPYRMALASYDFFSVSLQGMAEIKGRDILNKTWMIL